MVDVFPFLNPAGGWSYRAAWWTYVGTTYRNTFGGNTRASNTRPVTPEQLHRRDYQVSHLLGTLKHALPWRNPSWTPSIAW